MLFEDLTTRCEVGMISSPNKTKVGMRLPIEKRQVWEAYLHVRKNNGSYGVDEQDWLKFDQNRNQHLYQLWNRLSSGSYFPKPVRRVMIPKSGGGERPLGIPTVTDRIAQEVLRRILEPQLEPHFHANSYAYRKGKSAHDALAQCRSNTDYYSWVVDLDIKGYFDNIPHAKLMQALEHYCQTPKWLKSYLWRILRAPIQMKGGELLESTKGVPQGGVISPLLANLYLHVVFDGWIGKQVRAKFAFERYADDIVIHTVSEDAAKYVKALVKERFASCGLALHPEKSKLVQTETRKGLPKNKDYASSFDFLGHRFHKEMVKVKGKDEGMKLLYQASVAPKARKRMMLQLKYEKLHRRTEKIEELAKLLNQKVRGWILYFGKYAHSSMLKIYAQINFRLVKWCKKKYKKFTGAAITWLRQKWKEKPHLFAHWEQTKWFCYPFTRKRYS
jgi:group II intron reverse transcriptase/maturase